jgi:DUF971 family protein
MALIPVRIDKFNDSRMLISWNDGESYSLPYAELRFQCPCAVCVDEHTGKRILKREQVAADIRPTDVALVGRYAVQVSWSDGHSTGMFHFDRLHELCRTEGARLSS